MQHKLNVGDRVLNIGTDEYGEVKAAMPSGVTVQWDGSESYTWYGTHEINLLRKVQREIPKPLDAGDDGVTGRVVIDNRVDVKTALPHDSAERKKYPIMGGVLDYFPSAIAALAHHSYLGNEKHNPGQELHWARGKSDDHLDAAARHLLERDLLGLAWRALAALQLKLESEGHARAPAARYVNGDA